MLNGEFPSTDTIKELLSDLKYAIAPQNIILQGKKIKVVDYASDNKKSLSLDSTDYLNYLYEFINTDDVKKIFSIVRLLR